MLNPYSVNYWIIPLPAMDVNEISYDSQAHYPLQK